MKHTSRILLEARVDRVAEVVGDLSTYPHWNDVVAEATPVPDDPDSWMTTLRARVGPFARSKQLRMTRTRNEREGDRRTIRFERQEVPAREHAAWIMDAQVAPNGDGTVVELSLDYTGGLWTAPLEPVLGAAIDRATRRLGSYLASTD